MGHWPRPTHMPSFISIRLAVLPQCTRQTTDNRRLMTIARANQSAKKHCLYLWDIHGRTHVDRFLLRFLDFRIQCSTIIAAAASSAAESAIFVGRQMLPTMSNVPTFVVRHLLADTSRPTFRCQTTDIRRPTPVCGQKSADECRTCDMEMLADSCRPTNVGRQMSAVCHRL